MHLDFEIKETSEDGNTKEALILVEGKTTSCRRNSLLVDENRKFYILLEKNDEVLSCLTKIINTSSASINYIGGALFYRGLIYTKQGKTNLGMADYSTANWNSKHSS